MLIPIRCFAAATLSLASFALMAGCASSDAHNAAYPNPMTPSPARAGWDSPATPPSPDGPAPGKGNEAEQVDPPPGNDRIQSFNRWYVQSDTRPLVPTLSTSI